MCNSMMMGLCWCIVPTKGQFLPKVTYRTTTLFISFSYHLLNFFKVNSITIKSRKVIQRAFQYMFSHSALKFFLVLLNVTVYLSAKHYWSFLFRFHSSQCVHVMEQKEKMLISIFILCITSPPSDWSFKASYWAFFPKSSKFVLFSFQCWLSV